MYSDTWLCKDQFGVKKIHVCLFFVMASLIISKLCKKIRKLHTLPKVLVNSYPASFEPTSIDLDSPNRRIALKETQ